MGPVRLSSLPEDRLQQILDRGRTPALEAELRAAADRAIDDVRRRGDSAVIEYTARFDGVNFSAGQLLVTASEFEAAHERIPAALRAALETAITRVRAYSQRLRPVDWLEELEPGFVTGVRFSPLARVGVYIPSGKGKFPSTAVTMLTPAVVAGVREILVVAPPHSNGSVDAALLVVCDLLGVRQVFRCNGVAGVAALAVGTPTIPCVPAIVGPGNPYIAATQRQAQSFGVRMLALLGPTEAMILADEAADPRWLALDLISEAEHGADSAAILLTDSAELAGAVAVALPGLLARLPDTRRRYAEAALTRCGGIFIADSMDEAVEFVNTYAPEHLLIATREPRMTLQRISHAGEILLGSHTPFAAGNYAMGIPAALPTNQAARYSSGITVLSFLKASSVAMLDERGLATARTVIEELGGYEGFPAHVLAVTER